MKNKLLINTIKKKKNNAISIVRNPNAQSEMSYRHRISKEYKNLRIIGDVDEIKHYSEAFLRVVDGIVCSDKDIKGLPFEKPLYGFETVSADTFYFVSSVYLKERTFRVLEDRGLMYGTDFIWAPEWIGQPFIPACYPSSTWEDKEQTYDFSGQEGPWDYRYRILLDYLPRKFRSVMDCGAGNMSLRRMLPPPRIVYYPVDYKPNYPQTIVCDFNQGEFPALKVDAVFMCGILEYIENPVRLLENVCRHSRIVLMTYNALSPTIQMAQRCLLGWKSHMTAGDIVSIFENNKFRLVKELYADAPETYLVFEKSKIF